MPRRLNNSNIESPGEHFIGMGRPPAGAKYSSQPSSHVPATLGATLLDGTQGYHSWPAFGVPANWREGWLCTRQGISCLQSPCLSPFFPPLHSTRHVADLPGRTTRPAMVLYSEFRDHTHSQPLPASQPTAPSSTDHLSHTAPTSFTFSCPQYGGGDCYPPV